MAKTVIPIKGKEVVEVITKIENTKGTYNVVIPALLRINLADMEIVNNQSVAMNYNGSQFFFSNDFYDKPEEESEAKYLATFTKFNMSYKEGPRTGAIMVYFKLKEKFDV